MPGTTTRGAFPYPLAADPNNVPTDMQALADRMAVIAALDSQGTFANRPAAVSALRGHYYWASDQSRLYRCDGSGWAEITVTDGSITTTKLADGSVVAAKIADGAVSTSKLVNLSVTGPKLADGSVSGPKLTNLSVATGNLVDGSVTTLKLGAGAVTGPKIAGLSVATGNLIDGSVTNPKLAGLSVTGPKLADDAVSTSKVVDGSITNPKLADLSVTQSKMAAALLDLLSPVGVPLPFTGTAVEVPSGYALLDGSERAEATCPRLAALWGTGAGSRFGAALAGNVRMPDARGRMFVGLDSGIAIFNALGKTGGSRNAVVVTHGHAQNAHNHSQSSHNHRESNLTATNSVNHTHDTAVNEQGGRPSSPSNTVDNFTDSKAPNINNTTATNQNTGESATDKNLPPFLVMNWIIRLT